MARFGAGVLLGILALLSHDRISDWRSNEALWTAAIAVSPSPRALINLSAAELRIGRAYDALQHAVQAVDATLDPRRSQILAPKLRAIAYTNAQIAANVEAVRLLRGDPR